MILKICIFLVQLNMMRGEHPLLSAMKHAKYGPFGFVGLKDRLNGSLDYIENVLGHRIKFNESIHSFNNISYKYLTECDVKPLNKFLFTTTNFYDHNTYRKRFFQQKSREDMFTKKYEAKYARLRAASTKKITRHTAATNIFDSRMLMDNLLENYPDMVNHLVTQVPWPRKLWTGTYPPDEPKEHPNNTTPENWSLDLHEKFSEEDYKGPERRIDPGDSMSAYGLSLPKEKVHYADEYNSQLLPELERQWKIRGDKKNIEAGLDRPSDDNYDVRMYRPAATHYLAGCKIDLNHYRPFETMNQTLNPYLPYNEFYLRPGFDPVAWHRTIRDLHYEINPDSELSDPEVRKLFTLQDSENYGDLATTKDDQAKEESSEKKNPLDDFNSADYYRSDIYADSMLTTAELSEKRRRKLLRPNNTKKSTSRFKRKYSLVKTAVPYTTKSDAEIKKIMDEMFGKETINPKTGKPYHPDDSAPIPFMLRQKELLHQFYPNVSQFQLQELNEMDQLYVREKDILNCTSWTINMQNLRNIELRHNIKLSELPTVPMIYWVHPNRTTYIPSKEDALTSTLPPTDFIVTESLESYFNMTPFNIENVRNIERKFGITINDDLPTELPDSIVRLNDFLTVRADGSNDYHDLVNYFSPLKRRKREILNELKTLFQYKNQFQVHSSNKNSIQPKRKRRSVTNRHMDSIEDNLKRWENYEDLTKVGKDMKKIDKNRAVERTTEKTPTQASYYSGEEKEGVQAQQQSRSVLQTSFSKENTPFPVDKMLNFDVEQFKNMNTEELRKIREYHKEHSQEIKRYMQQNKDFIYEHQEEILDEEHKQLADEIHKKIGEPTDDYELYMETTIDPLVIKKRKDRERRERELNEKIYKLSNIRNRLAPLPGNIADYYQMKMGWLRTEEPPSRVSEEIKYKKPKDDGKIDPFQPYFKLPSVEDVKYAVPETTIVPSDFRYMNESQVREYILKNGIDQMLKIVRSRTTMSYKEFKRKRLLEGRKKVKGQIAPRPKNNKERINALFDENWKVRDKRLKRRRDSRKEKKENVVIDKIPFYVKERLKDQRQRYRVFDKKVIFKVNHIEGEIVTQKVTLKKPIGPLHYHVKKKKGEVKFMNNKEIYKIDLLEQKTTIQTRAPYDPEHESDYSEEDRPVNRGVNFESEDENSKSISLGENQKSKMPEKISRSQESLVVSFKPKTKEVQKDYDSFNREDKRKKRKDPNMDELDMITALTFHSCGSIKASKEIEKKAKKIMKDFRKRKQKLLLRRKHAKFYNFTEKSLMSSESDDIISRSYYEIPSPSDERGEVQPRIRNFKYVTERDGSKIVYEKEYMDSEGNPIQEIIGNRKSKGKSKEMLKNATKNNDLNKLAMENTYFNQGGNFTDDVSHKGKKRRNKSSTKEKKKEKTLKRHKRFLRLSTPPRHTTKGLQYYIEDPIINHVTDHIDDFFSYENNLLYSIGIFDVTTTPTIPTSTIQLLPDDYMDMKKFGRRIKRSYKDLYKDWWDTRTRTVFTRGETINFEDVLFDPITYSTFEHETPRKFTREMAIDYGRRKRSCEEELDNRVRQSQSKGYIGNVKLSVDILMKDIMVKKRRARRQALTATAAAVTDYWGKVEDPLSNCCNNSASREAFRRGVQMVKMKKYKQHFDAIKPPTTKITTEKSKLEEERAARVRRGNLEDLYPSVKDSGASHNLEKYGIDEEKQDVRYTTTRFPTTRLIYPMSNPTKTKLIEDIEKRFSLKIEDLTTPYPLQWSPYNLLVTDPELLDSDSILEVMDFYEEREFPTQSTKLNTPIFNFGTTEPEPTLYDFDNMTPFNMENVRKIEKKFNVSLKDFENHPDNMRIVASTFGFGFVGVKDLIVNISHEDTLIDKMEPAMQAILPTEYGFWDPENKGKTVEYGRRDWVLKDLLAEWKKIHNDSIETMHRKAVNMTLERKKLECRKLGITWTEPKKFNKVSEALAQEFTGSTFHPNDEAVMEDHAKHVEYVNNYNEKHSLWPTKCTEETYCPESEERQATIMDWILKDYTDLRLEHKKRVLNQQNNRPKREANSITLQPAEDEEYLDVVGTAKDCYQTFDDPREFQKALQSIHGGNNTIEGRENFKKAFMEMQESTNQSADGIFIQHGTNRVRREVSEQTESWLKRVRRDMPYLGYSGLTSKIIFRWTNYPYYKTIAPSFLKRSRIHARHRPTHHDGEEVHIKRKQWTVDFTSEPHQQTLKYIHGIPVREKLDYDWHFKNEASSPRNKRDLGRVTAMDDYSASGKDSPLESGPLDFRRTTEQSDDIQQSAQENDDSGRTSEATTTVLSSMFSNAHVATKHAILKRDLFTGSWNIIHQMTRTKSENIKNIERRFSVDIDKITTDQPFNMTLLLEMMSKLVHTYKLTLATLPTEPFVTPRPSLKYHTVYRREKRAVDRFMDYVADPVIQTLYGVEEVSPTTLLPHYRPETSTFWGSDTAWYHQTPDENDDTAWIYKPTGQYRREKRHMTEERRIPYIRANAYEERVTGHNFSHFMSMDPETAYIDRLKRSIRQNDLQKQPSLGLTESWLKRFRRDMPYLGYSGLTSKIIFRWTNYPYYKTIAPSFLKRSRIHARHRPTHHDGEEVHIKRKQWTVDFTSEPHQQTLKYIHGIPVREKLDYDWHFKNEASSPRNKRDLGKVTAMDDYSASGKDSTSEASGVVTDHVKAKRSVGTETDFNSITTNSTSTDRTAVSFSSTTTPSIAKPIISNLRIASGNSTVNETARVIGTIIGNNTTVTSSTNAPSTTDIGSQNPGANIINPVQTLGRKKRAVPAQRRSGKDLFEKIIMAYYNCKNVWKEPHSPEILQIRHRYREQKKRQFSRVFGRRKHEHVDIYYD